MCWAWQAAPITAISGRSFRPLTARTIALDTFSPKNSPSPSVYVGLETDDIEAEVARLKESGANVVMDTHENVNDEGRGICKMAIIVDPEGNPIMLHEIAAWQVGEAGHDH